MQSTEMIAQRLATCLSQLEPGQASFELNRNLDGNSVTQNEIQLKILTRS